MFRVFRNAWKVAELRKKILFTIFIIAIFRIGSAIPVPFLDPTALKSLMESTGSFLGYMDVITGGSLASATLFAMSVTPYINASIIINLLTVAIPALERMAKEGEEGRRKINKITRILSIIFAFVLATGYYFLLKNSNVVLYKEGAEGIFVGFVIVFAFAAGSALIMWLGEQINAKGIGNGISIIIFSGIVSRVPEAFKSAISYLNLAKEGNGNEKYYIMIPLIAILFIFVIALIVLMNKGERKIPVIYAKRVVGRKMYGGQTTHIPVKVNMSGVMPVIFAGSILSLPTVLRTVMDPDATSWFGQFLSLFNYDGVTYGLIYFMLIVGFNYFYVSITYNPLQMANDLRQNNGTVPGIRPGKPTSEYLGKVISRITLVGAVFLGSVAVLPIFVSDLTGITGLALGGTSVIIVVGVALETSTSLESLMTMRHHKGFLE